MSEINQMNNYLKEFNDDLNYILDKYSKIKTSAINHGVLESTVFMTIDIDDKIWAIRAADMINLKKQCNTCFSYISSYIGYNRDLGICKFERQCDLLARKGFTTEFKREYLVDVPPIIEPGCDCGYESHRDKKVLAMHSDWCSYKKYMKNKTNS